MSATSGSDSGGEGSFLKVATFAQHDKPHVRADCADEAAVDAVQRVLGE